MQGAPVGGWVLELIAESLEATEAYESLAEEEEEGRVSSKSANTLSSLRTSCP